MCGIAGIWSSQASENVESEANAMMHALMHRGPDSQAQWTCAENRVSLVHARLAVIDVSEAGAQPMHSDCGRYVITYNGEIYNHVDLRNRILAEAPTVRWRGESDTETLLKAIELWGFEHALTSISGMFAIALWDKQTKSLSLARDRMGEKPLYYGWIDETLVFASELKAIRTHPHFKPDISTEALRLYLETATVPAPLCIFEGFHKLPPASCVQLHAPGAPSEPKNYWSIDTDNLSNVNRSSEEETQFWLEKLDKQLTQSIEMQMASDVPLGAFLSGGYDSSLVVAMMQKASDRKVKTFSIGFENPDYDEAPYARGVAEHLGTEHRELYVSAEDIQQVIPKIPTIWDEPFADPSQIPTHLVSAMTREHVTVALSGDGGDELFGGYTRYQKTQDIWHKVKRIPEPIRRLINDTAAPLVARRVRKLNARKVINKSEWVARLEKLNRYLQLSGSATKAQLYSRMIRHHGAADMLLVPSAKKTSIESGVDDIDSMDFLHQMIYTDLHGYLPDTILTKVDRAAMAVSLETRAPLLDHALVELAWSMPHDLKVRSGQSKWCLKSVVHQHVPAGIMERPKKGFGIPLADWLRGPLREWAENLLSTERLERDGIFQTDAVRGVWSAHLSGNWQHENLLWNILMFQIWHDEHVNK